jgi:hypothetical protein
MTAELLNSGDWEVLNCFEGNPVPGDPQAIASLAVQLQTHSIRSQDHETQLNQIYADNADAMVGDYAESFRWVLSSLPRAANGLSAVYQACGQALDTFSDSLSDIQTQAAQCLQQATQDDSDYREAASVVCDLMPGTTMTGVNEPGPVWRGLTAELAESWAESWAEENPEIPEMAIYYGGQAQDAEMQRQAVVEKFQDVLEDYQAAVSQCVSAIQVAVPDMPYPSQSVPKLTS